MRLDRGVIFLASRGRLNALRVNPVDFEIAQVLSGRVRSGSLAGCDRSWLFFRGFFGLLRDNIWVHVLGNFILPLDLFVRLPRRWMNAWFLRSSCYVEVVGGGELWSLVVSYLEVILVIL